ncbi:exodeoxyribonuclease III [Candidatus Vampirococcus lugosii]|uniref:Exodeoxyribonuclease III n=1 Tax=Candidatus Vampirococcus lugosii TaxID=2789015 RepID=A0ABS5QKW7_9BACT|nr:exodeoxyribonuclease III [Candidatus Vampirococcus lugosii]MBS8121754.1 exodeoxyribonuclease III [Candidatus Vampirococcus lugosii]
MKIASWNVNGIRAVIKKGLLDWINDNEFDIFCLQETKAFENQIPKELYTVLDKYSYIWHNGTRAGYSGVATFFKKKPNSNNNKLFFCEIFEQDGRIIETEYDDFVLLNIYFPNGGTKSNGDEMLSHKLNFYKNLIEYVNNILKEGKEVIIAGDFNIAHTEIDLARPKDNKNSIGFLPIERQYLDLLHNEGYIDVFRYFNPELLDKYTWWSYRAGARPRNVGWRIDYFFVSKGLLSKINNVYHQDQILGSDHCPIVLEF